MKMIRSASEGLRKGAALSRALQTQAKPKGSSNLQAASEPVPVFRKAVNFTDRIAIRDNIGSYTYANLFMAAKELAKDISQQLGGKTNERIVFLCPNDATYVITQWAGWMSGQTVVPLSPIHPKNLLEYYCSDSAAGLLVTTPAYSELMYSVGKNIGKKLLVLDDKLRHNSTQKMPTKKEDMEGGLAFSFYNRNPALIIYTSGTTGKPKGVVLTHKNLYAQATGLVDAWRWVNTDSILHVLPLHHIHGIVNALLCPLYVGAKCIMLERFDPTTVWSYLLGVNNPNPNDRKVSIFMGVPTIYSLLIKEYEKRFAADEKMCEYIKTTLTNRIRLMVSGSSPLPVPTYQKWLEISGHKLLERYGMTEIGMCLSNVYDSDREPGYVGIPLPGVSVQLANKREDDKRTYNILLECSNVNGQVNTKFDESKPELNLTGELLVKGDSVFSEYYNNGQATKNAFTPDGWFVTGDVCHFDNAKKKFKMLGRTSVDIIKRSGYKISALEIETVLLGHKDVAECAVVGLPHQEFGEEIAVVVVTKSEEELTLEEACAFCQDKLPKYSLPTKIKNVDSIAKNAMGKVNKKVLVEVFANEKEKKEEKEKQEERVLTN